MQQVFDQVRKAKPQTLYIAVDGPRKERVGEDHECERCRDIVHQVDWPCEVHTLFREENVGCAKGVSGAISWAFESEERLIILEDDCVPVCSFFSFCDEMLEKYKDDTRVWQVSGRSYHANSSFFQDSDYVFSYYAHIWGWATWKRCWAQFDLMMSDFEEFLSVGGAENVYFSSLDPHGTNKFYKRLYKTIDYVSSHTWDYQWSYIKLKNGGLGIVPCKNLIHNIGSDSGAHSSGSYVEDIISEEMPSVIRHPRFVIPMKSYDDYHYKHHISKHPSLLSRTINKIKRDGFSATMKYIVDHC